MLPYLSAFILVHVTTSNGLAGRGGSAFRSSSNRPVWLSPFLWWSLSPSPRRRPGRRRLKLSRFHTPGTGTNGLRRTAPTRASTPPFSCPEYGLRNAYSNP